MTRNWLTVLVVSTLTLSGCTPLSSEMQVIHDAGEAMGGVDDIEEAQTMVLQGSGREYRLGQNKGPDDDLPYWESEDYVREIDLQNGRWRLSHRRTSAFLTGNPALQQEQILGLSDGVAYDVGGNGTARRAADQVARDRMAEYHHHPVPLVQLALAEGSVVGNLRQNGGDNVVDITSADGDTYTMHLDIVTKYPRKIVSVGYHPSLGDVTLTTEFDDYWETGGLGFQSRLTLPRLIAARMDEFPTWDLRVSTDIDQQIDLSAPAEARSAPPPLDFEAIVQVEKVADGVWRLAGQSHHSVLIEFADHTVLFEAPQNEARTLAVIEQARGLQPDKPLQYLINSHHHFDHSGGVRAAVSEGLTVITHELNAEFLRNIVGRPHTVRPDALARNPQELKLELVNGDMVYEMSDGRRTLHLVRILEDEHSDSILMGHLADERILIEADAFSPTSHAAPFATNLLKNVRDLYWRVDTIVPIHGSVVAFAALEAAVDAEANRSQ